MNNEHMTGSQSRTRQLVKFPPGRLYLAVAACAWMTLAAGAASAQLAPTQTSGFGDGQLLTFSYLQNFDCVDQPKMDLNFNKIKAQSDPSEMQTPICQLVTEPSLDPTGGSIKRTAHLYVLVPMFGSDTNPKNAIECPDGGRPGELCGVELGKTLIALFGGIPDAWEKKPSVQTQCPDPNNPVPGDLLIPVYGWFTEGVDTPVLQEAKGLLDELSADPPC
jgi:hypothetical protein